MKEPYDERLATHIGPKLCTVTRKGYGEALAGVRAGQVLSLEKYILQDADAVSLCGRQHSVYRYCEILRNSAWSETLGTYGNISHENRDTLYLPVVVGGSHSEPTKGVRQ